MNITRLYHCDGCDFNTKSLNEITKHESECFHLLKKNLKLLIIGYQDMAIALNINYDFNGADKFSGYHEKYVTLIKVINDLKTIL